MSHFLNRGLCNMRNDADDPHYIRPLNVTLELTHFIRLLATLFLHLISAYITININIIYNVIV